MEDFIFAPLVLLVSFGVHTLVLRRHTVAEGRLLTMSFAAHMAAGFAQILLTEYYFKGGDMMGYWVTGVPVADAMRSDFSYIAPAVVEGFFRLEPSAPVEFMPGGGATTSMSAFSIALLFLLGNSLYASVLMLSLFSYVSKVLLYHALRDEFSDEARHQVLIGVALLPSAIFWSCGLLKEPVIMAAMGPLLLGLRWVLMRHRLALAILLLAGGALMTALIKPYVLMAMSLAASAFYLWSRLLSRDSAALKPFAIISAGLIATGGLVLGNRYFSKGDTDTISTMSRQRQMGQSLEGGSNFSLEGERDPGEERSTFRELLLTPFAVFTALFRPVLFEARNAVQLANAIEATVLFVFFVQILRRRGAGGTMRAIRASPTLIFCLIFTLALAVGTGLSTSNMGTLSRYRAPMMPFFFTLLLVLRHESRNRAGAKSSPALEESLPVGAQARRA